MSITLTGTGLTVEKVVQVARHGAPVALDPEARKRIEKMPGPARGQDPEERDHVRRQHRHRRAGQRRPDPGPGRAVPALPHLQPRRRLRQAHARGDRPGGHPQPDQLPLPRPLGPAAGRHGDPHRAPQQGRDAGHVREGLGRRLRRPLADGPDGPRPHGRGRGLLQGRAPARRRGPQAGRHQAPRPPRPRRPGHDQRLERHRRHVRPDRLRRPPLAQDVRDRRGHDPRGPQRQHEGLRRAPAQDPRLSRRPGVGRQRPAHHRGERAPGPARQEGPGRLQPPQHAAGRRRRPRRPQVGPLHGRDRAQRRGRQPGLLPRRAARPDRGELPGRAHGLRPRAPGHGRDDDRRPLGAPPQPADEPAPQRRPAGLPDQGRGHVLAA